MASFSIDIMNPNEETYDGLLITYEWIVNSLETIGVEKEKIVCKFSFKIGNIRCTVDNIIEFKEHAYGADGYEFNSGYIAVHDKENSLFNSIHFTLIRNRIVVSTCDKLLLTKIDEALKQPIDSNESNKIINQYNISGNNIAIANDNSNATVVSESPKANVNNSKNQNEAKKESGFKSFVKGIFNNIVSNIIWYILGILFAGSSLALLFSHIFK